MALKTLSRGLRWTFFPNITSLLPYVQKAISRLDSIRQHVKITLYTESRSVRFRDYGTCSTNTIDINVTILKHSPCLHLASSTFMLLPLAMVNQSSSRCSSLDPVYIIFSTSYNFWELFLVRMKHRMNLSPVADWYRLSAFALGFPRSLANRGIDFYNNSITPGPSGPWLLLIDVR